MYFENDHQQPVLLLGASGMLGRCWKELLEAEGIPFYAPSRRLLDLNDRYAIEKALRRTFSWVINCAAYTDVDLAESESRAALKMNVEVVAELARWCQLRGVGLLHYSTDYVFSGDAEQPYPVWHPKSPINFYGATKAKAEDVIAATGCRHLIVRTSWLYAAHGKNFVRTMLRLMQERDVVRVVDDQIGRPANAWQLAQNSLRLLRSGQAGIHHLTDSGSCSWYELACAVQEASGTECAVEPCESREFPRPARRPRCSVLDISELERTIGAPRSWREAVRSTLQSMRHGQTGTRKQWRTDTNKEMQTEQLI